MELFLLGILVGWLLGLMTRKSTASIHQPDLQVVETIPQDADAKPAARSFLTADVKTLDSASVLLYFGAFLMVAGVGLFVGLSDYGGSVKTAAVSVMALTFYAAGLLLYHYVRRLQPVAITLTAIGLFCLPLTGVATYIYLADYASGPIIWFATSAVSFLFYIGALWRIRQSLIGYLSVLMCLSLWLSAVAVIQAPIHFFGWAMIVLGMIYLLANKYLKLWHEIETPLSVSASIMVPVALGAILLFGQGRVSFLDQGITGLLAALFYVLATWMERDAKLRLTYFVCAYSLIPLATFSLVMGTADVLNREIVSAFVLTGTATLQLALAFMLQKIVAQWRAAALIIGAITLGIAALVCASTTDWNALVVLLWLNLAIHTVAALWARSGIHMTLGLFIALILPAFTGYLVCIPALSAGVISAIYIVLALVLLPVSNWLRSFNYSIQCSLAYAVALVLAWFIGVNGHSSVPMFVSIAISATLVMGAYYKRHPVALYAAGAMGYVAAWQSLWWQGFASSGDVTLVFLLLALCFYAVGKIHNLLGAKQWQAYGQAWAYAGLLGLYLAALIPSLRRVTGGAGVTALAANAAVLMAAGALTVYEGYIRHSRVIKYAGAAVLVAGLQWLLYTQGVREMQIYTHMWAGYFAVLAWLAHRDKRLGEKENFTILALTVQTLPLAAQALAGDTELGLLLLFESVALVLFGLWAHNKLVSRWGLVVAVGSVLYQLRDFQFFVLVLLGAGVIGAGVYVLLRQQKTK